MNSLVMLVYSLVMISKSSKSNFYDVGTIIFRYILFPFFFLVEDIKLVKFYFIFYLLVIELMQA